MACQLMQINTPPSPADQSKEERGDSSKNNCTPNYLEIPSEKSWTTINIDLQSPVSFSSTIKQKGIKNMSQSDCYLIVPILRIIKGSKNFKFNQPFMISIKKIAKLLLNNSSQASTKRIKKILQALATPISLEGQSVLIYYIRENSSPIIKVTNSLFFEQLNKKNDYVQIPRANMKDIVNKLLRKPKAFSLYLEYLYVANKQCVSSKQNDRPQKQADLRLKELYPINDHHSLKELKHEAENYLKKILGEDFKQKIESIAYRTVQPENKSLYQQKSHNSKITKSYFYQENKTYIPTSNINC